MSHHQPRSRIHLIVAMLAVSSPALLAQKPLDVRIETSTPGTTTSQDPQIHADGDRVHVLWQEERGGVDQLLSNVSTDRGNTWLDTDVRVDLAAPATPAPRHPQLCIDRDRVYAVWQDYRNGAAQIWLNWSNGGNIWFLADIRVDHGSGGAATHPQIHCRQDQVAVVWQDTRDGQSDIYFNRSTDGGLTWLPNDVRLDTDTPGASSSVDVHLFGFRTPAGVEALQVAWSDDRNGRYDIYSNSSTDAGATWLPNDVRLDTDGSGAADSRHPRVTGGNLSLFTFRTYAVWEDNRNGGTDIYASSSPDLGATWGPEVRLDTDAPGAGTSLEPRIYGMTNAQVAAVWSDDRNGQPDIYASTSSDGGVTWLATDRRIDTDAPGAGASLHPEIQNAGLERKVRVVWQDDRDGTWDVRLNHSSNGGVSWLANDLQLDTEPPNANSTRPQIAAGTSDALVVWLDDRDGSPDVHANLAFGFQGYGSGKAGTGGLVPQLSVTGNASLGQGFSIQVTQGFGDSAGLLVLGGVGGQIAMPYAGGTLLVQPLVCIGLTLGGSGRALVPFNVPNNPAFVGGVVYFQAVLLDPGVSFGISMSPGMEMWIG